MKPSARSARNAAPDRRPTKLDARGGRHEHHRVRAARSGRKPAAILRSWLAGKFTLLTSTAHPDELRSTLQKPRVSERIKPHQAGRLVNQIKRFAEDVGALPPVKRSLDPMDDFLLAMCEAGNADYLMTGDKRGLLSLERHKAARIVSAREFAALCA